MYESDLQHGDQRSLWAATTNPPQFPRLTGHAEAHVCIVGAGISGLTTAYLLLRAGRSVVVLEDGPIAGGASKVTTAHLSNAIDDRFFEIERLHGAEGARLVAESHTAAIDQIAMIVALERIDCDFTWLDGYLMLSRESEEDVLDLELGAARRAGLVEVTKLSRGPVPTWSDVPCLRFPRQARFHPLKYLGGLARAIEGMGGRIFCNTHVDEILTGLRIRVMAGSHRVEVEDVVVATNSPVNDRVAIHTKQSAYMTYVIGAKVPRGSVPDALYWDTSDPYHYIRLSRDQDRPDGDETLLVGGEDHKTGQDPDPEARYGRLEQWARARFPFLGSIEYRWAGQVMETIDGIAFIGRNPPDSQNVFVITGDSGMGMTHGTIGGILVRDLILGTENRWSTLYDPARRTLRAAGTYLREAVNMAAQYRDWLTAGEVESTDAIAPEQGAVVRQGLRKVAAYRDSAGTLHEYSAICPHLGGIVRWNASEKTWDCPCHGSRFNQEGTAIYGPANQDLAPITANVKP